MWGLLREKANKRMHLTRNSRAISCQVHSKRCQPGRDKDAMRKGSELIQKLEFREVFADLLHRRSTPEGLL